MYTESRVCVCSTCVAVFARCVELSRGCGMIRAKSSTTQVCFICGVAGCEIRGYRFHSIFNRLSRVATPRWFMMICRLSDQTLSKIREQSSAMIPIWGLAELMQNPMCYVKRIICTMSGIFVLCRMYV